MRHLKFLCLLIVFSICLSSTGCQLIEQIQGDEKSPQKNTFVEGAYSTDSGGGAPGWPFKMRIRSESNIVDIFNAIFTIEYGYASNKTQLESAREHTDYPEFDIYFVISTSNNKEDRERIFYKHSNENFMSEKYLIHRDDTYKLSYSYSETVKIPVDLFECKKARIAILIEGINTVRPEEGIVTIVAGSIQYIRDGDKIYLSSPSNDFF